MPLADGEAEPLKKLTLRISYLNCLGTASASGAGSVSLSALPEPTFLSDSTEATVEQELMKKEPNKVTTTAQRQA